jgi:Ca2+-binding EF-hand superfamily protein
MSISGISSSSSTLQELLASWGSDQASQITQNATSTLASLFGGSDDSEGTTQASGLFSNRDKLIAMLNEGGGDGSAFAQTASLLGQLDKDISGGLSLDESGLEQESFDTLDTDGDGTVTGFELEAALKSGVATVGDDGTLAVDASAASDAAAQAYSSLTAMIMGLADGDQSGDLTLKESGLDEDTFSQFDLDGNGVITGDELSAAIENGVASTSDSSLSAAVSGSAASGASGSSGEDDEEKDYDELDTNKDGMVSTEELAAAIPGYAEALRLARGENGSDASTSELRRAMTAYGSAGGFDFASLFAPADSTAMSAGVSGLLEEIA